jgi:two-component system alkaline phosphatase synthesis response regulator PhoP
MKSKIKILIVDDEPDILQFLSYNLENEGYEVFTAPDGKHALDIAVKEVPHLVLLDVMMPGADGIETCMVMRKRKELSKTIIAILTARHEDYSQIAGFDAGADDYISKPVKPKVLLSRIKSLLRRHPDLQIDDDRMEFDGLLIDKTSIMVKKDGREIPLVKKEFELLAFLASKPGKVFSRESILNQVWGNDVVVGNRTIDVHIKRLREKIGEDYLKTVKGIGYKFEF